MSNLLPFPSSPRSRPIPDATQRAAALDITRSFIVEAPAGSGKTALLIQRFLKLLAAESTTDPAQILAITFTRKATHELRDRVLLQLRRAASNTTPANDLDRATRPYAEDALANDRRHGWNLLEHPDRLNISTIDSLCTRLANALPVLSGGGGLSPVEKPEDLHRLAAARTLTHLGDDPALTPSLTTLLLHRDNNLADVESLIAGMLGSRDQWANLIPLTGEQLTDEYLETVTLPRLEKALQQAICRALTRLDKLMPQSLRQELTTLARKMSAAEGYKGADSPIAVCRELHSAPGTAAHDLDHWRALAHIAISPSQKSWRKSTGIQSQHLKFLISPQHKAELIDLVASLSDVPGLCEALCDLTKLPPVHYPQPQWLVAKALFRILSHALVELQFVFQSTGTCDFTELTLSALAALRTDAALDDLASAAGSRLDHLLIDEMQDTSTTQYELIRLLTQSWDGHSQTIFLVGDPKQSIYLFRQARVERFLDTLRTGRLGELRLTPLHLTANFRSQSNLVANFNQTFTAIFPVDDEVTYRNADHTRDASAGPDLVWHPSLIPYDCPDKPAEHLRLTQQNAAEIRRLIDEWRDRPLPAGRTEPWKIAILGRNRKHLHEVTKALEPNSFQAIDIVPLGERQEVLDLLALTRALLHPADRTAWLALLRTPWCGLTLTDLHTLAGEVEDPNDSMQARAQAQTAVFDLLRERGALLSPDGIARLEPFWLVLQSALAKRGHLPLSRLVDRTARAFAADRFYNDAERANATRFLQMLEELEALPGPITIDTLNQRLEALYANPATADDQVQMLTIHKAKGLEWDFVVVPQMESKTGMDSGRLLDWLEVEESARGDEDVAHGIIAPVHASGDDAYALSQWVKSVRAAREKAEVKRLFYVAATRAKEELHLFAAPRQRQNGEPLRPPQTLLQAAWPAAKPHFEALASSSEPGALDELAAAANLQLVPPPPERLIQRIPSSAMPSGAPGHDSVTWVEPLQPSKEATYTRPEGSFEARILGNTTHTFLELLTHRIAQGHSFQQLQEEAKTWSPRIQILLRAAGLAPASLPAATATILRSLTRTLEDPHGRWLLTPHPEASTETSIATPVETIRLDRTFLAGPEPLSTGQTHLWIIDYKTGSHAAEGLEAFLAQQKSLYAPQLENYATHLTQRGHPIRLALYYPTLPQLLWWPYPGIDPESARPETA
jgi:ATP-dependent exoDNAse (exonuclease V) beta subunit